MPKPKRIQMPGTQPNPRNRPCFCGSGIKFKDCCEKLQHEVQQHLNKFDKIINVELEKVIDKQNFNRKNLVISRRPSDCFELSKVYYIKGRYDLLKVTSPPIPVVKTRADLDHILTIDPESMVAEDLTDGIKPEISIIMQNETATVKAEELGKE